MIRKNISLFLTMLIAALLLLIYLGHVIPRLNSAYFSFSGDGVKNYYTAEYHVAHDEGVFHFQGMNYPEGDHVLFTDGFFPLTSLLKLIKPIIDLSDYTHGIINGFLLLSILLAVFFLYKVLRELEINEWVAAVFSPGLIFFSPMIQRIGGHYSLSLLFFLPLLIYLLIKYYKNPKWKYVIWAGITVLLCSLTHLYHIALAGILIGGFFFYMLLFDRKKMSVKNSLRFFSISLILPYAIIFLIMYLTDAVSDRSTYPYGFMFYRSAWEGVFLKDSRIGIEFINNILRPDAIEWEGWGFIGHAAVVFYFIIFGVFAAFPFLIYNKLAVLFIILIFAAMLWYSYKRKKKIYNLINNPMLNAILWAGFVSLFISFAFPINIFSNLYYYIGPLRELRGIGRMNWIFFFAINIGMMYFIQFAIKNIKLKYALFVLVIISIYFNMHRQCKVFLSPLGRDQQVENTCNVLEKSPFNNPDFIKNHNAIIGIPAVLIGSENLIFYADNENLMRFLFLASQKSGLPMISSMMSRTSIDQTLAKASFFYGPYNKANAYLNSLPKGNYVVVSMSKPVNLRKGEELIFNNCDSVWTAENYFVGSISKKKIQSLFTISLPDSTGVSPEQALFWESYSSNQNEGYFTSGTSQEYHLKTPVRVLEVDLNYVLDTARELELSFWFSNVKEDALLRGSCEVNFLDSAGNSLFYDLENLGRNIIQLDDEWALYLRRFMVPAGVAKLQLAIIHYELKINSIKLDNILLRESHKDIFLESGDYIMKNNYFYPKYSE